MHVAKRLHGLPQLAEPNPVCGAFGMCVDPGNAEQVHAIMEQRLSIFAGFASRFDSQLVEDRVSLKGVGDVLYALLLPRPERVSMGA